jgi:hypothetical protein
MDSEKNGGHGTAVLRSGSFGAGNVPKPELGNEAGIVNETVTESERRIRKSQIGFGGHEKIS